LPNLVYTDGNGFSLWRDGELAAKIVLLDGDIETSGAKLKAPETLRGLVVDFLSWAPATADQRQGACADQRASLSPVARRGS
jgi:hypothetical protein